MMRSVRWLPVSILALFAAAAAAEYHTFKIEELFSNADGTMQYVVLHESAGMNGESLLTGVEMTSASPSATQVYTFLKDLPGGMCYGYYYMCMPSPTANKRVLIATPRVAAQGTVKPDYVMPDGFLAIAGGTLDYAGIDVWVYPSLPTDGLTALYRDGSMSANKATNFMGASATMWPTVTVVEYRNSDFDHYFMTPLVTEIALLDAHTPPFQAWSRTGFSFNAYVDAAMVPTISTTPATSVAICRFFNDHFAPKSSHFYAAHGFGCETTIAMFPDWMLEADNLFNMMLPDASGACPTGTIPVYRLYNNGMGGAPNHRFVTSQSERQTMIDQGWVPEGSGIGVGMCAPL